MTINPSLILITCLSAFAMLAGCGSSDSQGENPGSETETETNATNLNQGNYKLATFEVDGNTTISPYAFTLSIQNDMASYFDPIAACGVTTYQYDDVGHLNQSDFTANATCPGTIGNYRTTALFELDAHFKSIEQVGSDIKITTEKGSLLFVPEFEGCAEPTLIEYTMSDDSSYQFYYLILQGTTSLKDIKRDYPNIDVYENHLADVVDVDQNALSQLTCDQRVASITLIPVKLDILMTQPNYKVCAMYYPDYDYFCQASYFGAWGQILSVESIKVDFSDVSSVDRIVPQDAGSSVLFSDSKTLVEEDEIGTLYQYETTPTFGFEVQEETDGTYRLLNAEIECGLIQGCDQLDVALAGDSVSFELTYMGDGKVSLTSWAVSASIAL